MQDKIVCSKDLIETIARLFDTDPVQEATVLKLVKDIVNETPAYNDDKKEEH